MGVKQLWTLLQPVGRPVLLETMEGKALAIDSSIWIYQFQATMRDKEGRGLNNAHILGFLRRICKLLFYGIKPVFVFDGGAPVLKRSTIIERKRRKAGAALSHVKVAERLLAAQLRKEALSHVKSRQSATKPSTAELGPTSSSGGLLNEDTVYMEDLLPPVNSPKKPEVIVPSPNPPESPKKYDWKDHDPYKLPDVDMKARVAEATRTAENGNVIAVDPRLATEDELRHFIDTMRPEDFDASSPAFRELPTETQYEIIGDLRLKSRQTSHSRLQTMLKSSKTAMDFSKAQIRGLHARNRLTQQLLMTTNTMGKEVDHHIMIPVRIAAERNREYVLIKNEGPTGGWSLSIKDEGTKEKPIQVQPDSDDDEDMEEVPINEPAVEYASTFDSRRMALASIGKANNGASTSPRHASPPSETQPIEKTEPLFTTWSDVDSDHIDDDLDPVMTAAIEESWQQQEERDLKAAIEASRTTPQEAALQSKGVGPSRPRSNLEWGGDDQHVVVQLPAMSPRKFHTELEPHVNIASGRGRSKEGAQSYSDITRIHHENVKLEDKPRLTPSDDSVNDGAAQGASSGPLIDTSQFFAPSPPESPKLHTAKSQIPSTSVISVHLDQPILSSSSPSTSPGHKSFTTKPTSPEGNPNGNQSARSAINMEEDEDDEDMEEVDLDLPTYEKPPVIVTATSTGSQQVMTSGVDTAPQAMYMDEEEEFYEDWSRSPSPGNQMLPEIAEASTADQGADTNAGMERDWDAAHEVDVEGEEGEFARFVSQVKGKDLDAVRDEIEMEIKELHKAKKNHQRDSDEVTQQVVAEIMLLLRLFGIPYITAPMEAEAQCAALLTLGLVDGVITDDSDVFLFGATRVFRNMFNQSKTVECFLASDLQRELGLTREKLIQLAYLLGSDYVDGLPKCGPVVAMEMLNEFDDKSGDRQDSLLRFKEWWSKVQTGKDKDEDNSSDFKRRFKKKFKELHLSSDWPNPAVRDAYYHPTVDMSEENFKWGLPDLDGLRSYVDRPRYLEEELRWPQTKVDDLLVPIIRKMGERSRNMTSNRQSTLSGYFDASGGFGSGTIAPRKRQPYASKRLQQVVSDYRKKKDASPSGTPGENDRMDTQPLEGGDGAANSPTKKGRSTGKKRTKPQNTIASKPRKRQKVVVESESGSEAGDGNSEKAISNVPDRPLGITLRVRKAERRIVEDEDSDDFE